VREHDIGHVPAAKPPTGAIPEAALVTEVVDTTVLVAVSPAGADVDQHQPVVAPPQAAASPLVSDSPHPEAIAFPTTRAAPRRTSRRVQAEVPAITDFVSQSPMRMRVLVKGLRRRLRRGHRSVESGNILQERASGSRRMRAIGQSRRGLRLQLHHDGRAVDQQLRCSFRHFGPWRTATPIIALAPSRVASSRMRSRHCSRDSAMSLVYSVISRP